MNKSTRNIIIVIGIILIVFFASSIKEKDGDRMVLSDDPEVIIENAQRESEEAENSELKELIEINTAQYLEYYHGSSERVILLARPTCGYCQIAVPIMQQLAYEYNIDIYYLNTDNFTEEDQVSFIQSDEYFHNGFGTPLLFVVKDSKIISMQDGLTDKAHYTYFFKTSGMIKE